MPDPGKPLILYVNHTGQISGAEISLLRMVGALDRAGVRVAVACPGASLLAAQFAALDVPVIAWAPGDLGFTRRPREALPAAATILAAARTLRALIRRQRPAIVHANSIRAGLLAALATVGLPPPLVVHVRDDLPPNRVSRAVRAVLHRRAALILGVSRYTLARFRLPGRGGAHYAVLHDGVDPAPFAPESTAAGAAALRAALGLAGSYPLLGVVGQLTPWKGQDTAIEALARLGPRYPGARLLIVGEARFTARSARYDTRQYRANLEAQAVALGVADRVIFAGQRDDIPAVMAALNVLLVPSWSEPFGLVMVEAMAAGTPVVATRYGGPADVVRPGQDGALVEPRDPAALAAALTDLLADSARLRALGAQARQRVISRFTAAHQARRVAGFYRALLGARP